MIKHEKITFTDANRHNFLSLCMYSILILLAISIITNSTFLIEDVVRGNTYTLL